jgi:SNF2 family DNA or RNA helicase
MEMFRRTEEFFGNPKWQSGVLSLSPQRNNVELLLEISPEAEFCEKSTPLLRQVQQAQNYEEVKIEDVSLNNYLFKTKPWDHQLTALKMSKDREYFGYLMEQGTGKSKVIIDEVAYLWNAGKLNNVFIFAPKGVHYQWADQQFPVHCAVSFQAAVYESGNAKAAKEIQELLESGKDTLKVICVNIEAVSYASGQKFLEKCQPYFSESLIAIDEASRIRNSSNRTDEFLKWSKEFAFRRIATGTPISKGVENLYRPLTFLDEGILGHTSYYSFREEFCKMQTITLGNPNDPNAKSFKKIIGAKNIEKLQSRLQAHTYRILTSDCLTLPKVQFIKRYVELSKEQAKLYKQLKEEYFLEAANGEVLTFQLAIVRLHHALKILRGFLPRQLSEDGETFERIPNNRIASIIDFIKETGQKIAIWNWFTEERDMLVEALKKEGIGHTVYSASTARDSLERIYNDPDCQCFLSHPASGGIGLNLQVCSVSLWMGPTDKLEHYLQANSRVYRAGQLNPVTIVTLMTIGTTEEKWMQNIFDQEDLASLLLDGKLNERDIKEVRTKLMERMGSPAKMIQELL